MVSTRNISRGHANPPRTQDQQDDVDNRQPGDVPGALHIASNEMEALSLVNQRLLRELAELNKQVQRPQAHGGHDTTPQEEQQHLSAPQNDDGRGENSRTRGHDPNVPPKKNQNEGTLDKDDGGEGPTPHQRGKDERSWEQRWQIPFLLTGNLPATPQ